MSDGKCFVEGCDRPVKYVSRGWCHPCYMKWQRTGSPLGRPIPSPAERFWTNVQQGDGCWEWAGRRTPDGYGIFTWKAMKRGPLGAHRAAWILTHGDIPDGLWVLHHCDNPPCVRLDHLYVGTAADNAYDRTTHGRQVRGEDVASHKLTTGDVLEIRRRHAAGGITILALAAEYQVSTPVIGAVVRREWWRWLPTEHTDEVSRRLDTRVG